MKVLVCGGRNFNDRELLNWAISSAHEQSPITFLIHGGARGADAMAGQWARDNGIPEMAFPAHWDIYGRSAGYKRNIHMANQKPDLVIALPGGKGTYMIKQIAWARGIRVKSVA